MVTVGSFFILPRTSRKRGALTISVSIPGRINLLGNPTDGLEGDFCTLSAALSLRSFGVFEVSEDFVVEVKGSRRAVNCQRVLHNEYKYNGKYDIVKASVKQLQKASPEFNEKFAQRKFSLTTWTDIPPRSGLGGSSAIINMVLVGLRELYDLDRKHLNDYRLAEICTRVEFDELGFTCGYADRYSTLLGGMAYIDYRGKLYHKPIDEEPYATYERLEQFVPDLPIFVVYTGVSRDSGNVHGVLRKRYLDEIEMARKSCGSDLYILEGMDKIAQTARDGKKRLLEEDWESLGELMNLNHSLINQIMKKSGFKDGAGWANNELVKGALDCGALGAKLTGAGGGGCVFALTKPDELGDVTSSMAEFLKASDLEKARIIPFQLSKHGYRVF